MEYSNIRIGVIGLGYVGLPLAVEFGKKYPTIGFDINFTRINELKEGYDKTLELSESDLLKSVYLDFTYDDVFLKDCNVFIITVPTPIDIYKKPDLGPIIKASQVVGKFLKKGDIVIYESTVYPGCTEEDCVPILEQVSGLVFNKDFFCGYSPERINPGDKERTLINIRKITSGSTNEVALFVNDLYQSIIVAGTYLASSIKVAESAKIIENAQRDINIAFVNELSIIFNRLGIDTSEVLEAAGTKWNFLNFKPGLVGGHCIGVDPYYLAQKAQYVGYHPEIILSGRRLNDGMGSYIAHEIIKLLIQKDIKVKDAKILILGFTFKENCPDVRNTRVIDIINELQQYQAHIDVYDPWANAEETYNEYLLSLSSYDDIHNSKYDGIVLAVSHKEFLSLDFHSLKKTGTSVIYDVKSFLPLSIIDKRL